MPNLPTNIDATYSDDPGDPSVKAHQQAHDELHGWANTHETAPDPHGDRAWATSQFAPLGTVGAKVYNSAAQSLPHATTTVLAFNSEEFDSNGFHGPTNNSRLTIPVGSGGFYLISGAVQFTANGTAVRQVAVNRNGVPYSLTNANAVGSIPTRLQVAVVASLSEGDYLELTAYQESGVALSADAGIVTWFSLIRLGQ